MENIIYNCIMEILELMNICNWLEDELELYQEKNAYHISEPKHKDYVQKLEQCISDLKKNIINKVVSLSKELNYEAN